jgi:hypothetical protein
MDSDDEYEDYSHITDREKRRRVQNRNSQKRFRKFIFKRIGKLLRKVLSLIQFCEGDTLLIAKFETEC